jgi:hypothetical protein
MKGSIKMGTRGIYGLRKGGVDKLTYNHYDSYPEGLGADIVRFCENHTLEQLHEIFDKIILVDEETKPTAEQIEEIKKYNRNLSGHTDDEWYNLLRNTQGDLSVYDSECRYMIDSREFIKDSLFCEYGYIINLDEEILEYWEGFQSRPQCYNRYGETANGEYYPCKLRETFSLNNLPSNVVEIMQKLANDEETEEQDEDEESCCEPDLDDIAEHIQNGFMSGSSNGIDWSLEIG